MPSESFRFIHAARLLLDHQPQGCGAFPPEVRRRVEDATLTAFERVIDAALEHSVDFLLLVGDSFDRSDCGLRGQAALARGLARLEERDIPAFVTSGRRDPWSAWLPGLRFGENVYRLEPSGTPITYERDGEPVARLLSMAPNFAEGAPRPKRRRMEPTKAPFTISLTYWEKTSHNSASDAENLDAWLATQGDAGVQYWALGGNAQTRDLELPGSRAHDPGATQGLRSSETGPHGCSLWEVHSSDEMRSTFIPVSPLRWESPLLQITPELDRGGLFQRMRAAVKALTPLPTDEAWMLSWKISGSGPMFEAFSVPAFRHELQDQLRRESGQKVPVSHDFGTPVYVGGNGDEDRFSREFNQALDERFTRGTASTAIPTPKLMDTLTRGNPWEQRIAALLTDITAKEGTADLAAMTRGMGLRWFSTQTEAGTGASA